MVDSRNNAILQKRAWFPPEESCEADGSESWITMGKDNEGQRMAMKKRRRKETGAGGVVARN